jgi:hypothetical protein
MRAIEREAGLNALATYEGFASKAEACRESLLDFLASVRSNDQRVVAYGAAAKGNTLLNYCAVTADDIPLVVDRSPHKQGLFLPGSAIPIVETERLDRSRPDFLLVLAWNIVDEVMEQTARIRDWGGRFVTPVPIVRVIS